MIFFSWLDDKGITPTKIYFLSITHVVDTQSITDDMRTTDPQKYKNYHKLAHRDATNAARWRAFRQVSHLQVLSPRQRKNFPTLNAFATMQPMIS